MHFNPPPRAGGTISPKSHVFFIDISIHPPRAGRDSNHAQNLPHAFLHNTQYNVQLNYYSHTNKRIFC